MDVGPSPLTLPGMHLIDYPVDQDSAGSVLVSVAEDTAPPSAPGTPDILDDSDTAPEGITSGLLKTDNITRQTSPTFRFAVATDESGIQGYWWAVDNPTPETGGTWIAKPASGWDATVDVTPTATESWEHTLYVKAVDDSPAHNLGPTSELWFMIDTFAPGAPNLVNPIDGVALSHPAPTLDWEEWSVAMSGTYRYRVQVDDFLLDDSHEWLNPDRAVWVDRSTSEWDVNPALSDGSWNWRVFAEDCAGNQGSWSSVWAFTVAVTSDPAIGRLKASPPVVFDQDNLRLEARNIVASAGAVASVTFYQETNSTEGLQTGEGGDELLATDTNPSDGWAATIPAASLADYGPNIFYAQVTDTSGHTSADGTSAAWATSQKRWTVPDPVGDTITEAYDFGELTKYGAGQREYIGNGIYGPKDADFCRFSIPWPAAISLQVDAVDGSQISTLNSYLRLFDATGVDLSANGTRVVPPGPYPRPDSVLEITLQPGTYYVGVSGLPNRHYDPRSPGQGSRESDTTDFYWLHILLNAPAGGSWQPVIAVTAQYDDPASKGFGKYLIGDAVPDLDNEFTVTVNEPPGYTTTEVVFDSDFSGSLDAGDARASKIQDGIRTYWTWSCNVSDLRVENTTLRLWAVSGTEKSAPVESTIHTLQVPAWMDPDPEMTTITFDDSNQQYVISSLKGKRFGTDTPESWPEWLAYRDGKRTWNGVYFGELVEADYSLGGKVTAQEINSVLGFSVLGYGKRFEFETSFASKGSLTIDVAKLCKAVSDLDSLLPDDTKSAKPTIKFNWPKATLTWEGKEVLGDDLRFTGQSTRSFALNAKNLFEVVFPKIPIPLTPIPLNVVIAPHFGLGFTVDVGWTCNDAAGCTVTTFGAAAYISAGASAELQVFGGAFSGGVDATVFGSIGFKGIRDDLTGDWSYKMPASLGVDIDLVGSFFWGIVSGRFNAIHVAVGTDDLLHAFSAPGAAVNDTLGGELSGLWMAVPDPPAGVSASDDASCHNVRVTWNAVSDATAYEVWRNTANDPATASKLSFLAVTDTSYDDTTAVPGTQYWYWVKAKNEAGASDFSASDQGRRAQPTIVSPAVARSASGDMAIAWSQVDLDGTAQPLLVQQRSTSGIWGIPTVVASGNRFRGDPALTYLPDGRLLALWSESELDPALLPGMDRNDPSSYYRVAKEQEIFWSVYNAGVWTAPQAITDSALLDDQPAIVVRPNGTAVAAWRHASTENLDDPSTMDLWYATFDGAAWSPPALMFDGGAEGFGRPALTAVNSGDVLATWLSSTDRRGEISDVRSSILHDGTWSPPTPPNTISDTSGTVRQSPRLATLPDGRVLAFWTEATDDGRTMRMAVRDPVSGDWGDSTEVLAPQQWIGFPIATADGSCVDVVWHCVDGDYSSVFSVSRDFADDHGWTPLRQLTAAAGEKEDWWPMAATDSTGDLNLAYVREAPQSAGGLRASAAAVNIQTLRVDNLPDLAVTSSDISVVSVPPEAGQANSVRVAVRNVGRFSSPASTVCLYDGDPGAGGSLIDLPQPLPPLAIGAAAELTIPWEPTAGPHDLWVVIDQASLLDELDEANNAAHIVVGCVGVPTLALDPGSDSGAPGDGWTTDTTPTFTGTAASNTSVAVFVDSEESPVALATVTGGSYTVTLPQVALGFHTIRVQACDEHGNTSPFSEPLSLVIDVASLPTPGAPGLDPASDTGTPGDGITSTVRPRINGTASHGASVELRCGTTLLGSAVAGDDGSYFVVPTQDWSGSFEITAVEVDNSGDRSDDSPTFALTVDATPPQVASHEVRQSASGLSMIFTEDVSGSLAVGDLILNKVPDGARVDPAQMDFYYDPTAKKASWTFPRLPDGKLADGEYTATLAAADVNDAAGNFLDGDGDGIGGDAYGFSFVVGAPPSRPEVQVPGRAGKNAVVIFRKEDRLRVQSGKGKLLFDQPLTSFSQLVLKGNGNRPDTVTVDFAKGGPFVIHEGIVFEGETGKNGDTLVLRGTKGADAFTTSTGSATVHSLVVQLSAAKQLILDGGMGNDAYGVFGLGVNATVVDSRGADLLDFSQASGGVTVNLGKSAGQRQRIFADNRSTLAVKGRIENVLGTSFADSIRGNSASNRINGGGGDDWLYGEGGNDALYGEAGNNVLVGGAGNDNLDVDANAVELGRNLLIGGLGADTLSGGPGEEILIGGTTSYDSRPKSLAAVMAAWESQEMSFADRCQKLDEGFQDTAGAGWVQLRRKDKKTSKGTVLDDAVADVLFGGPGSDWFLAFPSDDVRDYGPGSGDR